MNDKQQRHSRMLGLVLVAGALIGSARAGNAQVLIVTPPLRAVNTAHVCALSNLNATSQFVTISIIDDLGQTSCTTNQTVAAGGTYRLACPLSGSIPGDLRSCFVTANNATVANKMKVSLGLQDAAGTVLYAVNGSDSVTTINNGIATPEIRIAPGFPPPEDHLYECLVVNTGPTINVTVDVLLDNGTNLGGGTTSVGQDQIVTTTTAPFTSGVGMRCVASGATAAQSKQLRVAFSVLVYTDAGDGPGSTTPVEGGL